MSLTGSAPKGMNEAIEDMVKVNAHGEEELASVLGDTY